MHSKNVIVSHTNQPVAVIALHNPCECVCVCTAEEAFSTWLHLTDPSGHAFTDLLHLYASISWLRTMSRPANQALRTLRRVCRALGGGGRPYGLQRRRRPAMNPEEVIRRPVTSLVQSSKKAAHWHDVILHMSTFIMAAQWRVQNCEIHILHLAALSPVDGQMWLHLWIKHRIIIDDFWRSDPAAILKKNNIAFISVTKVFVSFTK